MAPTAKYTAQDKAIVAMLVATQQVGGKAPRAGYDWKGVAARGFPNGEYTAKECRAIWKSDVTAIYQKKKSKEKWDALATDLNGHSLPPPSALSSVHRGLGDFPMPPMPPLPHPDPLADPPAPPAPAASGPTTAAAYSAPIGPVAPPNVVAVQATSAAPTEQPAGPPPPHYHHAAPSAHYPHPPSMVGHGDPNMPTYMIPSNPFFQAHQMQVFQAQQQAEAAEARRREEAAETRRREEAAETRRREEAAAAETRRLEEAAAAETRRLEEAAAAETRRLEAAAHAAQMAELQAQLAAAQAIANAQADTKVAHAEAEANSKVAYAEADTKIANEKAKAAETNANTTVELRALGNKVTNVQRAVDNQSTKLDEVNTQVKQSGFGERFVTEDTSSHDVDALPATLHTPFRPGYAQDLPEEAFLPNTPAPRPKHLSFGDDEPASPLRSNDNKENGPPQKGKEGTKVKAIVDAKNKSRIFQCVRDMWIVETGSGANKHLCSKCSNPYAHNKAGPYCCALHAGWAKIAASEGVPILES